ncbi:hypothetical protein KDA23_03645 [Candidatus Saccharibacteria bacterium]|nr:hypothetical protein [Candidatus Saccharibacteria bacterium]
MELSPELQEIKNRFLVNFANGGLPAVEQMVDDLAAEAEGAKAFADAGHQIADGAITTQDGLSDDDLRDATELGRRTTLDSIEGMTRHSFAAWLLSIVKE